MSEYSSYYLYQRYEKRGDQPWLPSYPNTLSIDGDGTMPLVVKEEDDPQCGYVPPLTPIYEWRLVSGYICDECGSTQYRWYTTSTFCDGNDKYAHQKKQYSSDGVTWIDVSPLQTQDIIIEYNSDDCQEPPTPSFDGKWLATYTSGTTSSAECDSTSAITSSEITLTNLESFVIGDCVTSIGGSAFYGCASLINITIPNSVTSIGGYAFDGCSGLTSINIPSGITIIENLTFSGCKSLTSVTIPSGVTSIGDNAFRICSGLTSITIPDSVTSIGASAFYKCTSLTSVTIGSGVTRIVQEAFYGCSGLTSITVEATSPPMLYGSVFNNTNNSPIYVPTESVSAYKSASGWSNYASRIQPIPST